MPPKASAITPRGRGRPARTVVAEPVIATTTPKKRGRPAKVDITETVAEPPKKRGRPSKAKADEAAEAVQIALKQGRRSLAATEAVIDAATEPVPVKRAGRPRKEPVTLTIVEEVASSAPKARGRPRKVDVVDVSVEAPKRRGRPPKNATAPVAASRAVKSHAPAKPAPRIAPKMRSRLRTRTVPEVVKEEVAPVVKRRRGPNKVAAAVPAPKKTVGRKAATGGVAKPVTKVVAPRKRRGYTNIEVPDKFVPLVQQLIAEQLAAEAATAAPAEEEVAEEEANEGDIESAGDEPQVEAEAEAEAEEQDVSDDDDNDDSALPQTDGAPELDMDASSAVSRDDLELEMQYELGSNEADDLAANPERSPSVSQSGDEEQEDQDEEDALRANDATVDYTLDSTTHMHTHDTFTDEVDTGTADLGALGQIQFAANGGPVETEMVTQTETVTETETVEIETYGGVGAGSASASGGGRIGGIGGMFGY